MELIDHTKCLIFIRENPSVPFGSTPENVYAYELNDHEYQICFTPSKIDDPYMYSLPRVKVLYPKSILDPRSVVIRKNGLCFNNVQTLVRYDGYLTVCFKNGRQSVYDMTGISIERNTFVDARPNQVMHYLQDLAASDELVDDHGNHILKSRYDSIEMIPSDTLLANYLSGDLPGSQASTPKPHIYPFGLNESQKKAVEKSFSDRLSIIQGPPGTGKTQTILNVIANNIIQGRTTAVVSNNASAVENVLEKMEKHDLGFLCALLGKKDVKNAFFVNQEPYPEELSAWLIPSDVRNQLMSEVVSAVEALGQRFHEKERLAEVKMLVAAYQREYQYFREYAAEYDNAIYDSHVHLPSSEKLVRLWVREESRIENQRPIGFLYQLYVRVFFGSAGLMFVHQGDESVVPMLQDAFYRAKLQELRTEANALEKNLEAFDFNGVMKHVEELSMAVFKAYLCERFSSGVRRVFEAKDLFGKPDEFTQEYPVVLSTTFSLISSLNSRYMYDSVLMDESSQINIPTGALALANARNAVIVGDQMQLANVVKNQRRKDTDALWSKHNVSTCYRYSTHSFLTSILELWPNLEPTFLREHYRCHPKIIDFCNKMYYGESLVIMTEDHGEEDVLAFHRTVPGNFQRGYANRRQVAVLCEEVLPGLRGSGIKDVGIIAPYNEQVDKLKVELGESRTIATIHKFQGRENEAIILTTVQDTIDDFVGNPSMVNVAVSRAKKKLRVIASQNQKGRKDSGIEELARYIEYNGFEIVQSSIRSVFDLLYRVYDNERRAYLKRYKKVSRFDSENLMAAVLTDMLSREEFVRISFSCHVGLATLIGDEVRLSREEHKYAFNPRTHVDFLLYREMNKQPLLAIEVDAWRYHHEGTEQYVRDRMKDGILERCGLKFVRLDTDDKGEVGKVESALREVLNEKPS